MVGLHTFLIISNQTTIEFYMNKALSRDAKLEGEVRTSAETNMPSAEMRTHSFGSTRMTSAGDGTSSKCSVLEGACWGCKMLSLS